MAGTTVTWNGQSFTVPATGDQSWSGSSGVDGLLISLAQNGFQKTGGLFTLAADADFGPTAGLKAVYFKTRTSNLASAGAIRFAVTDLINWRNNANNADLSLGVNGSDQLTWRGNALLTSTGALTASRALVTDGSSVITSSSVTSTELGRLSGVLSSVRGISDTATLTNKTMAAGSNTFSGFRHGTEVDQPSSGVHGVTGSIVGTTDSQTLTNKTIAAGSNTISGLGGSNFSNQNAGTFLAGPTSGSAAAPTFRALQAPTIQKFASTGTTTGYLFTISTSTTCAQGDTYTNNGQTFTVQAALSAQSGQVLFCTGTGAPSASGTLTRSSGSGTSSITFTSFVNLATYTLPAGCLYIRVRMVGAGGGGSGSGSQGTAGTGANGGSTIFGSSLLVAGGGGGGAGNGSGSTGGTGGSGSLGTATGIAVTGATGQSSSTTASSFGGQGGSSALGGAGAGTAPGLAGGAAVANTGSGGGGGGGGSNSSGSGGGSGAFVDAIITSPSSTYFYAVGTKGTKGSAGTSGFTGGDGADGLIEVTEYYQ